MGLFSRRRDGKKSERGDNAREKSENSEYQATRSEKSESSRRRFTFFDSKKTRPEDDVCGQKHSMKCWNPTSPGCGAARGKASEGSSLAELSCRYVVTARELGNGAYGSVVLGHDALSGKDVAIKCVPEGRMKTSSLDREVLMLERLSATKHPALLQFHAHIRPTQVQKGVIYSNLKKGESMPMSAALTSCHCIVTELVRGGELFDHIVNNDGLTEREAGPLFAQLLDAVRVAHCLGIAHRDLKLENVLLCGKPGEPDATRIKLIDWGLAHQHKMEHGHVVKEVLKSRCGSRSYMAPEVSDREIASTIGYDGFKADIWSLGVCLFAIHLAYFPFEEAQPAKDWRAKRVLEAQQKGESTIRTIFSFYPNKACKLSEPLIALLDRMLVFDPAKRATLEEVLESEWMRPLMVSSAVAAYMSEGLTSRSEDSSARSSVEADYPRVIGPLDTNAATRARRQDSGATDVSSSSTIASSVYDSIQRLEQYNGKERTEILGAGSKWEVVKQLNKRGSRRERVRSGISNITDLVSQLSSNVSKSNSHIPPTHAAKASSAGRINRIQPVSACIV